MPSQLAPALALLCLALLVSPTGSEAVVLDEPFDREAWFQQAHSADPKARAGAMTYAWGTDWIDAEMREEILLKLADESADVREAATYALADRPLQPRDEATLVSALADVGDERVGGAIAYAIGNRNVVRPGLAELLHTRMRASSGATKSYYAFALHRQPEGTALPASVYDDAATAALPLLEAALDEPAAATFPRLAYVVATLSHHAPAALVPHLTALSRTDSLRGRNATRMLRILGDTRPALAKAPLHRLRSADESDKREAVLEIERLGVSKPSISTAIGRCARDEEPGSLLQLECIEALGQLRGATPARSDLLDTLTRSPDARTRAKASRALLRVDRTRLEARLPAIEQRDPELGRELRDRMRSWDVLRVL